MSVHVQWGYERLLLVLTVSELLLQKLLDIGLVGPDYHTPVFHTEGSYRVPLDFPPQDQALSPPTPIQSFADSAIHFVLLFHPSGV